MNRTEFKDLLNKILAGEPVYITGSGTRLVVTHFSKTTNRGKHVFEDVSIRFIDTPNKKDIDKCMFYDIRLDDRANPVTNQRTYKIDVSAHINYKHLRAVPFKTEAAEVLFGKEKRNGKV